jgi:hypothetical protein
MSLLKRKPEKTTTISVRVPVSIKQEMDTLRQLSDASGFDLTASLTDAVVKWTKQVREELGSQASPVNKTRSVNGAHPPNSDSEHRADK